MNSLRRAARIVSGTLGRESAVINALRPVYDGLLDWSSSGRGIVQTINDCEQIRVDPYYRVHFPEVKDPEVCGYMREHVRPGAICLNIGAHVGLYAFCLAQWSAPCGRVFAFEPNPATGAVLKKHVALNNAGEQIEVVAAAVSDVAGEVSFFATDVEGFSRLGQPNPYATHTKLMSITVPMTSVDIFCAMRNLSPDWITMDIEGYEGAALVGARETIKAARGRLTLILEMHPNVWSISGTSREQIEALMAELSLKPIPLTGQKDPLAEFGIVCFEHV